MAILNALGIQKEEIPIIFPCLFLSLAKSVITCVLLNNFILKISIIVAKAKNNVIGKDNQLPWHLPADLRHFKNTTSGHHVIMGRKTFESMAKPLPNRTSLVITRNKNYSVPEGHHVVHSLEGALEICRSKGLDQVFILGGAEIFEMALPVADELIITEVKAFPEGDTFFPSLDYGQWEIVSEENIPKDEKNKYDLSFLTYNRRNNHRPGEDEMTIPISNPKLKVTFSQNGAELLSLLFAGTEYIWQADPSVWNRHAPVLFPIVGRLKEDSYWIDGKSFQLPQHGFARDRKFDMVKQSETAVTFLLKADQDTLKCYPFDFKLYITYTLMGQSLEVKYEVENNSTEKIWFSIGGHPAFNCPLDPSRETFEDYELDFCDGSPQKEIYRLDGMFLGHAKEPLPLLSGKLNLNYQLFDRDAIILDALKPHKISLKSKITGKGVSMTYQGFKWLGIWTKGEGAGFICLEPWDGIADTVDHDQDFTQKLGIHGLPPGEKYEVSYVMEFF